MARATDFLHNLLDHFLRKADAETDPARRFEILDKYVRPTSRRLRNRGFVAWGAVVFTVCLVTAAILWLSSRTKKTYFHAWPGNYLRIVQNLDPCKPDGNCGRNFIVQSVVDGHPNPETHMRFDKDEHFEAGEVFQWIRYTDLGSVQVTDGFDMLYDANGQTVHAPNCRPDYSSAKTGHYACEGGKARF